MTGEETPGEGRRPEEKTTPLGGKRGSSVFYSEVGKTSLSQGKKKGDKAFDGTLKR